jgi:hypothetical protein
MLHSLKTESIVRAAMNYGLSGFLPLYIVTEYPKSGGSWFSQMLSEYLDIPFPRNKMPKLECCVMHGHYLYFPTMKNVFVVLRDGRDLMVSYYYHSYFKHERFNAGLVERMRRELPFPDYDNIRKNLPQFIRYKFTTKRAPRFTWTEFVESWLNKDGVAFVKYENLLADPVKEFSRAMKAVYDHDLDLEKVKYVVAKYSFKNVAKRDPGQENKRSFLRKGIRGDWKNHFTDEARKVFNSYAGDTLVKLGYEADSSWIYERSKF